MKPETKKLARQMYATIMINAQGLGSVSSEQRITLFKEAAEICFKAAAAFEEVEEALVK
jgi:hypothetical protein